MIRVRVGAAVAGVAFGAITNGALAGDAALVRASGHPLRTAAAAAADVLAADDAQAAYDAARNLQEAVRASGTVSTECRPLKRALGDYAGGVVHQTEGYDRPDTGWIVAGARRAARAHATIARTRSRCHPGGGRAAVTLPMSPSAGAAWFGTVVARAPVRADSAELLIDRRPVGVTRVTRRNVRFRIRGPAARYDVTVRFLRGGRTVGESRADDTWLLPASSRYAVPGARRSAPLGRVLSQAMRGGPTYRAAWAQDLRTGAFAGSNAGAVFPAASLVKIGLMAGVTPRLGGAPERSAYAYDLQAVAAWSSNLAGNRLVRRFGVSSAAVGLRRLGARSSTFTGDYMVGTELQPDLPSAGIGRRPPRVSRRVTTAQDMARMLFTLHSAAVGVPRARRESGLTGHQARLLLGWLLSSQQAGDNRSLFAAGAGGAPIAQKNGWLRSARHGAALIYADRGPVIVVLLTQEGGALGAGGVRRIGARIASGVLATR